MTERALGGVVGRLDALDFDEGPQMVATLPQLRAEAGRERVEVAAQQQRVDLPADRLHAACEGGPGECPVADPLPQREQFERRPHQVAAEPLLRGARAVDPGLEIPFEMGPAPLQSAEPPVHPGAVAVDDAGVAFAEQFLEALRRRGWCGRRRTVNVAATKVQTHALVGPSFVGDSSMFKTSCFGSCAASSS